MAKRKSKFFNFHWKRKGKPTWVPADKETGRPGYWIPSFARITVSFNGLCLVFPCKENRNQYALREVCDRMIAELEAIKTEGGYMTEVSCEALQMEDKNGRK